MELLSILTALVIFAGVLGPFFWLILHFRDPIPLPSSSENNTRPKNDLEEIFGA